jgi:pilus assembly protein Flp/PilA
LRRAPAFPNASAVVSGPFRANPGDRRDHGDSSPHRTGPCGPEDLMKALLSKLAKDESGQGLVEYALIIALVSIGLIAALRFLRQGISSVFSNISRTLTTVS